MAYQCRGLLVLVLVVVLFLAPLSRAQQHQITCQSEDDYYHFLYKICTQSTPCRHLFHLYPMTHSAVTTQQVGATPERDAFIDYRNDRDFQLFRHQLATKPIFRIGLPDSEENNTLTATTTLRSSGHHLVLQNTMPDSWLPTTTVFFKDESTACSESDVTLQEPGVALSALYGMHIYKMTVADEFFCHDPNERLLIDPLTNETFCICKTGKSCNNDSNFDQLFTFLLVILIFGIIAFIIAIFAGLFYKRHLLHEVRLSAA